MIKLYAILCDHIANGEMPILLACRDSPIDDYDSGWQFLCNCKEDDIQNAKMWSLEQVMTLDPSIIKYVEFPYGTVIARDNRTTDWVLIKD